MSKILCWHDWRTPDGRKVPDWHVGDHAPTHKICRKCGKRKRINWRVG
jgi:hypothetical protein